MARYLCFLCFLTFLFSCKDLETDTKASSNTSEPIVYDMYEPSEMANLMNEMYAYNLKVKKAIVNDEDLQGFPIDFLKIHTAELSDFKSRNETFKSFSKLFIDAEKTLYDSTSVRTKTERFNAVVNVCISCHQTECTGPIPRIKKLLIK